MTSELDLVPDLDRTPATLFASPDPAAIVAQATRIANEIAPLIREQRLVKRIGSSDHVFLEGWTLAGTMLGVFPITVSSGPIVHEGEVLGYQATVEARTMAGNMVGRADAQCTHDEGQPWKHAPSFQLRSMAITRASSKALRMPLGFVMHLAGYDATPAEEMEAAAARGETVSGGHGVQKGWKDLGEQQRGHADVGKTIEEHGLRQWVAEWIASKGYGPRPWAKGQLTQLRRAIEQEVHWRQTSDPATAPTPPGGGTGSDPTSEEVEALSPTGTGAAAPAGSSRAPSDPMSPPEVQPIAAAAGTPAGTPMSGEEGERVKSGNTPRERRDDPSSSDSRPEVPARVSSGWKPGERVVASGEATSGRDPTSAAGSSGSPAEGPPVGSPAADQTSGEGERETPTSVGNGPTVRNVSEHRPDRHDPSPDPSSPTRPESEQPGRVGGNVETLPVELSAEELRPVFYWCQRHNVDMGLAATYLRRSHKKDFADLKDRADLAELQGPKVGLALDLLHQQFVVGRKR